MKGCSSCLPWHDIANLMVCSFVFCYANLLIVSSPSVRRDISLSKATLTPSVPNVEMNVRMKGATPPFPPGWNIVPFLSFLDLAHSLPDFTSKINGLFSLTFHNTTRPRFEKLDHGKACGSKDNQKNKVLSMTLLIAHLCQPERRCS